MVHDTEPMYVKGDPAVTRPCVSMRENENENWNWNNTSAGWSCAGASPYPGIAAEQLCSKLKTGYRMNKPTSCSDQLYVSLHDTHHIVAVCFLEAFFLGGGGNSPNFRKFPPPSRWLLWVLTVTCYIQYFAFVRLFSFKQKWWWLLMMIIAC